MRVYFGNFLKCGVFAHRFLELRTEIFSFLNKVFSIFLLLLLELDSKLFIRLEKPFWFYFD